MERLSAALKLIDVRTLDHIVVGRTHTVSLAELGVPTSSRLTPEQLRRSAEGYGTCEMAT